MIINIKIIINNIEIILARILYNYYIIDVELQEEDRPNTT